MIKKLFSLSRYPEFLSLLIWRVIAPFRLRNSGASVGSHIELFGSPIVSMAPNSHIFIGDKVSLCSVSKYTALGVNHPVILRTLRARSVIDIGEDTGMSGCTICAAVSVKIGRQCLIGANVSISDSDFHSIKAENRRHNDSSDEINVAPVNIGNNVFIGTNSIILKGVAIGDNSVVGAGSIVTKSFPKNSIIAGNPAKLIGQVP